MHRLDQLLRRRRAGGDADGAVRSSGSSSASLTRKTRAQPASRASFSSARVLDELAEPITTTASQRGAIAISADWRLVVAKHRSLRPGRPQVGEALLRGRRARRPSRGGESVVWASRATGSVERGQGVDLGHRLDPVDRVGRHRHRADGLLVALVADVDDVVALAGPHLAPRGGPWSPAGTPRRPRSRRGPGPRPRPRAPSRGPTA